MDHPFTKRASDMTTGERRSRMEKLLMGLPNEDTPSRSQPAVSELPSWTEMGRLILAEQQQTNKELREFRREVSNIRVEIAVLKTKSGFIGTIAGLIAGGIMSWFVAKGGK